MVELGNATFVVLSHFKINLKVKAIAGSDVPCFKTIKAWLTRCANTDVPSTIIYPSEGHSATSKGHNNSLCNRDINLDSQIILII